MLLAPNLGVHLNECPTSKKTNFLINATALIEKDLCTLNNKLSVVSPVCTTLLTTLLSLVLIVCVGTQACPRCLQPAPAEGRTGARAGSPYLARLHLAPAQRGRSILRIAPPGKVILSMRDREEFNICIFMCVSFN